MHDLTSDVRLALRGLAKRKAQSLLLVSTLAVGLAANGVIFNVLDALVLRAFDFPNQARLVRVFETSREFDGIDLSNVSPANLLDWQEQQGGAFRDLVGLQWWPANLRGRETTERIDGYRVGPAFFTALGVSPQPGRGFLEAEARPGQDRRVVLGHALWQRAFGGDPTLVGQTLTINGEPFVVVGIAPPGFQFPDGAEAWAPLVLPAAAEARRDWHYLSVLGWLADGRTREDAKAALSVVARRLEHDHPLTNAARGVDVSSLTLGFGDPVLPRILVIWQAGAFLVLLIACVNVANLILARTTERQRELAVRLALGAGRARVVRQLVTEGVVAALGAVLLAMPLTALASRTLRDHMPAEISRFLPGWAQLGVDWRTLLFSAALAVVAAGLFSALPALRASRPDLNEALRDGGRSVTVGGARQRGRNVLVVAQLTAAVVLVATAGLAVRSADALINGPQGFEPGGVLVFDVSLSESRYPAAETRRAFVRDVTARLAELPGVSAVAVANTLPGRGSYSSRPIEIEGQPLATGSEPPEVEARSATPSLFDTLRLPLLEGRALEPADDERAPGVAVVSRSMAERFWPGLDPIGRRFRVVGKDKQAPWVQVVGVSGDVIQQWAMRRNAPTFYRPFAQDPSSNLAFAVRTRAAAPETLAGGARRALRAVDPDQPAYHVKSMRRSIAQSTIGLQYVAAIMAAFGALALVLAVSGVYGVMSYRVSRRTLEIGVRVALGASRFDVLRLTLGQAARLSALGLLLGSGLAFAAGRFLSATLRGAVAFEPAVLAGVTALLAVAALVAAWVPAQRALGVDPARALRSE
jgi:putative ABC transport system permease protein